MSDPTALMVSYYFPPLLGIASERADSFRRHLPAHGWTPVVIAPRAGHYHRSAVEPADDDVVRTRNPEISRLLRGMHSPAASSSSGGEMLEPVRTGTLGSALRGLVRDAVYVPDAQLAWIPFAVRAGVRALRERSGNAVVYSSSVPYSSHIAARRIARAAHVPWVAEFRDPWTTGQREHRVSPLRHRIDVGLHASLLRSATRVLYTSEATRREVLNEFDWLDEAKTGVVRNGFELAPDAAAPPAAGDSFVLQYAGTVTPGNDVRPILRAVADVNAAGAECVRLRVAGNPQPWMTAAHELFGLQPDWLECSGMVSPDAARSLMAGASANLLVMYGAAHASKVPGKLYEYIGARHQ
jgi:glycosyltransferase involved in cell wall biosynthesis